MSEAIAESKDHMQRARELMEAHPDSRKGMYEALDRLAYVHLDLPYWFFHNSVAVPKSFWRDHAVLHGKIQEIEDLIARDDFQRAREQMQEVATTLESAMSEMNRSIG